ncbi:MAG: HNH endonuclease [Nitrosomonas sp.]
MNRWNIPDWLEKEVIARDECCVYCSVQFGSCDTRKSKASWEHIINDARIVTRENIALCCVSCNASKGTKLLADWITSPYCQNKNITSRSVADVVKRVLVKSQ